MTYKMSDFPDIDQNHVTKLLEAGIGTTDDLMRLWRDQAKRATLAERTGIGEKDLLKLAAMARLARVKNVGVRYVELLMAADIDGPQSLFGYTAETLVKHLGEVTSMKNLKGQVPTLVEVGHWFPELKPATVVA